MGWEYDWEGYGFIHCIIKASSRLNISSVQEFSTFKKTKPEKQLEHL